MSKYVDQVIANVKEKHGNEPEFVQTVEEVLSSLAPVIDQHPKCNIVNVGCGLETSYFRIKPDPGKAVAQIVGSGAA